MLIEEVKHYINYQPCRKGTNKQMKVYRPSTKNGYNQAKSMALETTYFTIDNALRNSLSQFE